jgi:phage repressor protein C with HTH and peptisase S24 domain
MLSHDRIWSAIDALADRYGMTASGLARKAGLDPTSFNRSKRTSPEGRERWPSTESIAKILRATGASVEEFVRLIDPADSVQRTVVPVVGLSEATNPSLFTDDGLPTGESGWEQIDFPDLGTGEKVFALEVTGDALLPLYRDGDVLILSPTAGIRKGDRIVVRTRPGEIVAGELKRRLAKSIELRPLGHADGAERTIPAEEVEGIARVMWARQ